MKVNKYVSSTAKHTAHKPKTKKQGNGIHMRIAVQDKSILHILNFIK